MEDVDELELLFARLAQRFRPDQEKQRPQGGRSLTYITARAVMNRLDDVMGPQNWWDTYQVVGDGSAVVCYLTIELPGGKQLTKCDVGGVSKTQDPSDEEKSAFSDAFKRAAVKFGVGRYLYGDGRPEFTERVYDAMRAAKASARNGVSTNADNGN